MFENYNVITPCLFIAAGILSAIHSGESLFSGPKGFFTWVAYMLIAMIITIVLNKE